MQKNKEDERKERKGEEEWREGRIQENGMIRGRNGKEGEE